MREQANRDEAEARSLSVTAQGEFTEGQALTFATLAQAHATLALLNQQRAAADQQHEDVDLLLRVQRNRT